MSAFGRKADIWSEQVWQGNSLAREENWGQPYHFVLAYALTLTIATVHFTRRKSLLYAPGSASNFQRTMSYCFTTTFAPVMFVLCRLISW